MGPLYAYRTIHTHTEVRPAKAGFEITNGLDSKIYSGSITLDFLAPAGTAILSNGKRLPEQTGATDRWDQEYFRPDGEHVYGTLRSKTVLEFHHIEASPRYL